MGGKRFEAEPRDFELLRELLVGDEDFYHTQTPSLDRLAKRLGVHPNTVAARLKRMTEANTFLPLSLLVNCNRLGFTGGRLFVPLGTTRRPRSTIDSIFRIEGIYCLVEFVEGWEVILFADNRRSLETKAELVRDLLKSQTYEWEVRFDEDWPTGEPYRLSALDVKTLAKLAADARQSSGAIAAGMGVTARTVQLRLERLRKESMFHVYLAGSVGPGRIALGYLCAEFDDPAKGRAASPRLKHMLPNSFTRIIVPHKQRFYLWANSLDELAQQADAVSELHSVSRVRFRVLQNYRWNPNYPRWLHDYLINRN